MLRIFSGKKLKRKHPQLRDTGGSRRRLYWEKTACVVVVVVVSKDDDGDDEDQDDDEEEMRLPPGSKKKKKKKRALAKRSIEPIHTPESWHALIHAGKDISEKTIRSMQGLVFKIDGKVIKGENMTKEHFEILDQARLTCRICKQTKMVAPATRKGIPTCLNCYRSFFNGGNHHTLIDAPVP